MSKCIRGMSQSEVFMELTKEDMGKCNGCPNLTYSHGMMTCPCMESTDKEYNDEN